MQVIVREDCDAKQRQREVDRKARVGLSHPTGYQTSIRLIYGENDRALPDIAKTMQRLQRAHPEAELTPLPTCGHFLQEDDPQRVGQLISEFLNRP